MIDGHEELRGPLLELVIDMAGYAPFPILEKMFTEIKRVPLQGVNEGFLNFLHLYTLAVLKNIQRQREEGRDVLRQLKKGASPNKEQGDDKFALYDTDLIWSLATHSATEPRVELKIKDQAMACLIKISEENDEIGKTYVEKALSGVKEDSAGSIRCMRFIVHGHKTLCARREILRGMRAALGKDSGMLELVIKDLVKYKQKVNAAVGPASRNIMTTVLYLKL